MIINLKETDIGCHINGAFYGCLLYADDIVLISPSVVGLQRMFDVCFSTGIALSLTFNGNNCLCLGNYFKFCFAPMTTGLDHIAWCEQITYLGVVINAGRTMKFDIAETRRSFFIACNSIFSCAPRPTNCFTSVYRRRTVYYFYCMPLPRLPLLRVLNSCWNLVYRRIFGFNIRESVKLFICGLGRFDICHPLLLVRRTKFYRHLLAINSDSLCVLYQNYSYYFN
jgi:hypothetical protein